MNEKKMSQLAEKVFNEIWTEEGKERKDVLKLLNILEKEKDDLPASYFSAMIGETLRRAAGNGYNDILDHILDTHRPIIDGDQSGWALWNAAIDGNVHAMDRIISTYGAEIKENDYAEALDRTASNNHLKALDYLLDNHGNKFTAKTIGSALHGAASLGRSKAISILLQKRPYDISNEHIKSALDSAKRHKDLYDQTKHNLDHSGVIKILNNKLNNVSLKPPFKPGL